MYIRQSRPFQKAGNTIIKCHLGVVLRRGLVWLLSYPPIGSALEHRPTVRCSRVTSLMFLIPPYHTLFLHCCQYKFEVQAGSPTCLRQWILFPIKRSSPDIIINCIIRYFTKVKMRYWTDCMIICFFPVYRRIPTTMSLKGKNTNG